MDNNIVTLQSKLIKLGYDLENLSGEFDESTKLAVRIFQKDHNLTPDGIAGPITQQAIDKYCIDGKNQPQNINNFSRFLVTSYMAACESDCGDNKIIPAKDDNGNVLAMLDPHFFANLALEGTGRLNDGRVLNVTGKYISAPPIVKQSLLPICQQMFKTHYMYGGINSDASKYFAFKVLDKEFPWGVGMHNEPLKLWKSLASDPSLVKFGTKVYILELDGMQMPDGSMHDGWCSVDDTGSAIKKNHFDWFVGSKTYMKQIKRFDVLHIWFEGSESIFPSNFSGVI